MNTLLKVVVGVVIAILLFWIAAPLFTKIDDKPVIIVDTTAIRLASQVAQLKDKVYRLEDTVFSLRVDKGYMEIELNRSRVQLDNLVASGKKYRILHDTVSIVRNCDSIIDEVMTGYIPASEFVIQRANLIDSIQQVQMLFKDSIESSQSEYITILSERLSEKDKEIAVLVSKNRRQKKTSVFVAIGGFIVGVFSVLFIN